MNIQEIKERVAAGLRGMTAPPSALLYREEYTDYAWDYDTMIGLPLIKCCGIFSVYDSYTDNTLVVLPVGCSIAEVKRFVDGYDEYDD